MAIRSGRPARPPRARPRWIGVVAALLLLTTLFSVGSATARTAVADPGPVTATYFDPPARDVPALSATLPGSDPAGEVALDVPNLVLDRWTHSGGSPDRGMAGSARADPSPSAVSPSSPVRRMANATSWVRGWVIDSVRGVGIPNASVSVAPVVGACRGICGYNLTDSGGVFNVSAPPGVDEVTISTDGYLTNRTWVTVPSTGSIYVGRILLVHDGYAVGVVRSSGPGHPTVDGIQVSSTSLDGLALTPGGITGPNGTFNVSVPPLPSVVTFDASLTAPGFVQNSTFTNATPYAAVDLGTIYIEGGFRVRASFVDRVTGQPLSPGIQTELGFCSDRDGPGTCPEGPLGNNSTAMTFGVPGPARVVAFALGYVVNETSIPDLPPTDPGVNVSVGPIYLTPMGSFQVTTNFTGGTPPNSTWSNGSVNAIVCSDNGVQVAVWNPIAPFPPLVESPCVGISPYTINAYRVGVTARVFGPPLQVSVFLEGGTGFPIARTTMPGSHPSIYFPTTAANVTWLNLTPDRLLLAGSLDLTPGRLITGHVDVQGTAAPPAGGFHVTACSTDEVWVCGNGSATAGCLSGNDTFCVPAPAGPIRLSVSAASSGVNQTWLTVPRGCCGQEGTAIDVGRIYMPASGPTGTVNGTVVLVGAPPGGVAAEAEACVISPTFSASSTSLPACVDTPVNATTGAFSLLTNAGWNQVRAFAGGYESNWTWVDVTGTNTTGPILLAPDGFVSGQVVTPDGRGLYAASVQACRLGDPTACVPVGSSGQTSTNGQFYGAVPGYPFPAGSYEITASAGGYATNWAWANVTSGALTALPPIVLAPQGVNATPALARATAARAGAWVDGRIVDSRTGLGIPNINPSACPVTGGPCTAGAIITDDGGAFNLSLAPGQYRIYLNATDHSSVARFVNLTSASYLHLGTVPSTPYPRLVGRVDIGPWRSLTEAEGLGPSLSLVQVCDAHGTTCASFGSLATDGSFHVSAPYGTSDLLTVLGGGIGYLSAAGGGFDLLRTYVNVTSDLVTLPRTGSGVLEVKIFGLATGFVLDGSVLGSGGSSRRAVPFAYVHVSTNSGQPSSAYLVADGGGRWIAFLPTDGNRTVENASASAFWGGNTSRPSVPAPAGAVVLPNVTLPHFGWATFSIVGSPGGGPLAQVPVQVAVADPANGTTVLTNEWSNGAGLVNITAPAGNFDLLSTVSRLYVNQSQTISVTSSRTTFATRFDLAADPGANGTWVQSAEVNTVGHAPVFTVVDNRTLVPVGLATVSVVGGSGAGSAPSVLTNALGQFLTLAGPGSTDQLTVIATSYAPYLSPLNLSAGARLVIPRVNLTGDGVVAGRVVVRPGNLPAPNVEVMVCPLAVPSCLHVGETNASGGFWVDAPPGPVVVTVVTEQFLANVTLSTTVPSDGFMDVGDLPVYAFANVSGTLLALPTGQPIAGGTASVCSPFGTPSGACFESVQTDPLGRFSLPVPPSTYVFRFSATGFNTTYLTVSTPPGKDLPLGTIFLFADGLVIGTVVAATNDTPIANASLLACAPWIAGTCLPPVQTNASGGYLISLPPGETSVDVSAPGFFDNFTSLASVSGAASFAPPIVLTPYSRAIPVVVEGRVTIAGSPGPIAAATVAGFYGKELIAATTTNASGGFALELFRGQFRISVSAAGYRTVSVGVILSGNLSGEDFALEVMTYAVSGVVSGRATGLGISGVEIDEGTTGIASTGSDGRFSTQLANGTYSLLAVPPHGSPYRPLPFSIAVNGASVVHDLSLPTAAVPVTVHVESDATGLPIGGAVVSITGNQTLSGTIGGPTDPSGNFSSMLLPGTYRLDVIASGYPEYQGELSVANGSTTTVVALGAASGTSALPLFSGLSGLALAGAIVAAAVLLAVVVVRRLRPGAGSGGTSAPAEDRTVEWRWLEP